MIIARMHRHASSFTLLTMTLMAVTQQANQEVEQILNFYPSVPLYAYTFRGALRLYGIQKSHTIGTGF